MESFNKIVEKRSGKAWIRKGDNALSQLGLRVAATAVLQLQIL